MPIPCHPALIPGRPEWLRAGVDLVVGRLPRPDDSALAVALELREHRAWELSGHRDWAHFCAEKLGTEAGCLDAMITEHVLRRDQAEAEDRRMMAEFGHLHRFYTVSRCELCGGCLICRLHDECREARWRSVVAITRKELLDALARDGYVRAPGWHSGSPHGARISAAHDQLVAEGVIRRTLVEEPDAAVRDLIARGVTRRSRTGRVVVYVIAARVRLDQLRADAEATISVLRREVEKTVADARLLERDPRLIDDAVPFDELVA